MHNMSVDPYRGLSASQILSSSASKCNRKKIPRTATRVYIGLIDEYDNN